MLYCVLQSCIVICTHIWALHAFNGLFSRTTWVTSTRKVNHSGFYWSKRWWGGSGISWTICKSFACRSRQITMPVPHHTRCYTPLSFYRPDALPAAQPTASKHWRHSLQLAFSFLFIRLCHFVPGLFAFVVLVLVSLVLSQEIDLEERLQNDLFCVELDAWPFVTVTELMIVIVEAQNQDSFVFEIVHYVHCKLPHIMLTVVTGIMRI